MSTLFDKTDLGEIYLGDEIGLATSTESHGCRLLLEFARRKIESRAKKSILLSLALNAIKFLKRRLLMNEMQRQLDHYYERVGIAPVEDRKGNYDEMFSVFCCPN